MTHWVWWSHVVQGLVVSLGTSAIVGTWTQIVTSRRHKQRLAQEDQHHREILATLAR